LGGQHIDPRDALAEELARTRGDLQVFDAMVASLELSEGLGGLVQQLLLATGMPTGDHAPHVLVRLRLETQKHYSEVATAAHRARLEERRVQLEADRTQATAESHPRRPRARRPGPLPRAAGRVGLRFAARQLRALSAGEDPTAG
jgi:hypothetical protein